MQLTLLLFIMLTGPGEPQEAAPPASVEQLIKDLGNPQWKLRDAATTALSRRGPEIYEPLRLVFSANKDFESRRRIRDIVREVYMTEHLSPPRAFLGISHSVRQGFDALDGRCPPWGTALSITDVFQGSAAYKSGLRPGDMILALNGKSGTFDNTASGFTQWIGSQRPGTQCEARVLRGGLGLRLMESENGSVIRDVVSKATTRIVHHADDARVPHEWAGVLVEDAGKVPSDADFRTGDLILAFNDQPIPLEGTEAFLSKWKDGEMKAVAGRQIVPMVGVIQRQNQDEKPGASIYLLRGGEGFDLKVELGYWPTFLWQSSRATQRADGTTQAQVIEAFDVWWSETFDPNGELIEQSGQDPKWQIEPSEWGR